MSEADRDPAGVWIPDVLGRLTAVEFRGDMSWPEVGKTKLIKHLNIDAFAIALIVLFSAGCIGAGTPSFESENVDLGVLVQPPGKGLVEINGLTVPPGQAISIKRGKSVNLFAKPTNNGWRFAGWERGLSGSNPKESLLMDSSKIVLAIFAPTEDVEPTQTQAATPAP